MRIDVKGGFKQKDGSFVCPTDRFLHDSDGCEVRVSEDGVSLRGDSLGLNKIYYAVDGGNVIVSDRLRDFYGRPVDEALEPLQRAAGFVPYPFTIFKGVRRAFPGVTARVDREGIAYDETPVRQFFGQSRAGSIEEFRRAFLSEIERMKGALGSRRLIVSLSGGFDSLLLANLFKDHIDGVVHYAEKEEEAEALRGRLKGFLPDVPWCVFTPGKDAVEPKDLESYFGAVDEPCCDVAGLAEYLMVQKLKRSQTGSGRLCVLNGEGADSIFGQGREYFKELWMGRLLLNGRGGMRLRRLVWYDSVAGKIIDYLKSTETRFFDDYTEHFQFLADDEKEVLGGYRLYEKALASMDRANFYGALELVLFCSNQATHKLKTIADGIDVDFLTPFYDRNVIRLAFSVGSGRKAGYRSGKNILKNAFPEITRELYATGAPWSSRLWERVAGVRDERSYMEYFYNRWRTQACR